MDVYKIILDTLTAFGTAGAVVISLWSVYYRKKKFLINSLTVNEWENVHRMQNNCLAVKFENLLEVKMEVLAVDLEFCDIQKPISAAGASWTLSEEFVAPLSKHEILFPLERGWQYGALRAKKKIRCKVKTSFGNATVKFPQGLIKPLCDALELAPSEESKE